eukprot:COSAG06_NODE_16283_length_1009_cov_0.779121_2_plen_149_part_00
MLTVSLHTVQYNHSSSAGVNSVSLITSLLGCVIASGSLSLRIQRPSAGVSLTIAAPGIQTELPSKSTPNRCICRLPLDQFSRLCDLCWCSQAGSGGFNPRARTSLISIPVCETSQCLGAVRGVCCISQCVLPTILNTVLHKHPDHPGL